MSPRKLTHISAGGEARMVDVSQKPATERVATAQGRVAMSKETLALVLSGNAKKGDVLGAARIAGIMAAKKTHELIPLCHPLPVSKVGAFQDAVLAKLKTSYPQFLEGIRKEKALSPALEGVLKEALADVSKTFA